MGEENSTRCNPKREQHPTTASSDTKKRKRKEVAVFGNYRNYYGYRIGPEMKEDPRLKAMKMEWFEGKDCLDIGCNSGLVTITIAKKFCCKSILGIDIDGARVEDANWTLRKIVRTSSQKVPSKTSKTADVENLNGLENHAEGNQNELIRATPIDSNTLQGRDLFDVVSFQKGNFIQSWHPPKDKHYNAILCLSVTKWIQLNWGDDGLITLFTKVWSLLHPGGVFILEPQPWVSYYNNRLVSETTKDNYHKINIRPEDFQDILLDKVGFRMVEDITSNLSGHKAGFNRPIFAFWK